MAGVPLRVGLVGCGGIAGTHLDCYTRNPRTKVVAVADVFLDKAKALGQKANAPAYQDYREMIAKEKLDVIGLLTPAGLPPRDRGGRPQGRAARLHREAHRLGRQGRQGHGRP